MINTHTQAHKYTHTDTHLHTMYIYTYIHMHIYYSQAPLSCSLFMHVICLHRCSYTKIISDCVYICVVYYCACFKNKLVG